MSPRSARKNKDTERKQQQARKRTKFRNHAKRRQPNDLHTIPSFCESNAISESFYYALKQRNKGPREMEVDGIVRITPEAEVDWRREREAETAKKREAAKSAREQATTTEPAAA